MDRGGLADVLRIPPPYPAFSVDRYRRRPKCAASPLFCVGDRNCCVGNRPVPKWVVTSTTPMVVNETVAELEGRMEEGIGRCKTRARQHKLTRYSLCARGDNT